MRLDNKIVLITGGGGGIGAATASIMAAEGATVVVTDVVLADDEPRAGCARAFRHDVTDPQRWAAIVEEVHRAYGRIDVLVNAAGVEGSIEDGSPLGSYEEWKRVLAINLDGPFLGIQAVLPGMLERGEGSIINLSSLVTFIGAPFTVPYGASKAGLWHLSRSVASFAATMNTKVRCNSVHPGLIRTRMTDSIFESVARISQSDSDSAAGEMLRSVPFGVRGEPDDVAWMIVFLASDESRYITGSEFKVDGGWSLNNPR